MLINSRMKLYEQYHLGREGGRLIAVVAADICLPAQCGYFPSDSDS